MNKEILDRFKNLELRKLNSSMELRKILLQISELPLDYVDFMSSYNGGVGFVGDSDNYLDLWTAENVNNLNPYFPNEEFAKQVIIIGSNGSGTLYGFDLIEKWFFETDEYEMDRASVTKCGNTFLDLIKYLETNGSVSD